MERYFRLCKKLANLSDHHSHQIGVLLVNKKRIVSRGFNKLKTSPRSNHPFNSIHGELDAILKCNPLDLKNATIYVYRETKDGKPANSKPCPSCQKLIQEKGIKAIVYSHESGYIEETL